MKQNGVRIKVTGRFKPFQALGFQIPWITIFQFSAQRSWKTISVTTFWFRENSWEPKYISFNVQKHFVKHSLKLTNISVYYYLQKPSMSIKMSGEGQYKC